MTRGGVLLAVALTLAGTTPTAAGQAAPQPDLAIVGRDNAFLVGDDLHNADGVGQQLSLIAGRHVEFEVVLENEGDQPETFVVKGSSTTEGFFVTYHRVLASGVRDLTDAFTGDGLSWTLRAHARRTFVVFVDADVAAPLGAEQRVLITAASTTDPSAVDAVRARITNVSTPGRELTPRMVRNTRHVDSRR